MLPRFIPIRALATGAVAAAVAVGTVRVAPSGAARVVTQVPVPSSTIASPGAVASSVPAISVEDYLNQALSIIERNSIFAGKVDMGAIRRAAEQRAAGARTFADLYPIIEAALKATGDKHAAFRAPVTTTLMQQGRYEGYGFVAVWPSRTVISVTPAGPAAVGGMQIGDRIDRIDGKAPRHTTKEIGIARDERGNFPPRITVTVVRRGETKARVLSLRLGQPTLISIPQAQAAPVPTGNPLAGRIGFLSLPGVVGDKTAQTDFATQVQRLLKTIDASPRCGWVLDLRANKGGYIAAMLAGIAPLLGEGPMGGEVQADGTKVEWSYRAGAVSHGSEAEVSVADPYVGVSTRPVALLLGNLTASAAEATALAFIGRPNVRTFGEATTGLTSYTVLANLPDGASLTVTNGLDVDAAGRTYDGPIQPDETVKVDYLRLGTADDPVLHAALAWLSARADCAA